MIILNLCRHTGHTFSWGKAKRAVCHVQSLRHRWFWTAAVYLILTINQCLFGQSPRELDSLEASLKGPFASDSLHASAFVSLINYHIRYSAGEEAKAYIDSLRSFADRTGWPRGDVNVHYYLAYYYYRRGGYDVALHHIDQAVKAAADLGDLSYQTEALGRMAAIELFMGHHDSAEAHLEEAIETAYQLDEIDLITGNLIQLAAMQRDQDKVRGLETYLMVDSLDRSRPDVNQYHLSLALTNIGLMHLAQDIDIGKALQYLEKAKEVQLNLKEDAGTLAGIDVAIGRVYAAMGKYEIADSLLAVSLQTHRTQAHARKIGEVAMFYGTLKLQQNDIKSAEDLFMEAKDVFEKIGEVQGLRNVYSALGSFYSDRQNWTQSVKFFEKALRGYPSKYERGEILLALAGAYRKNGQVEAAHDTLAVYLTLYDSINQHRMKVELEETERKYQTSQKEKEIVQLKLDQSQIAIRNQQRTYAGLGVVALLLAISFFLYFRSQQRRKVNDQLKLLDKLKTQLFTDISHEFRTPLSLIRGPIEMVLKEYEINPMARQQLQVAFRNSNRLNQLVDNIKDLTILDAGRMALQIKETNLSSHLKTMAASFESQADVNGLIFEIDVKISNGGSACYDPDRLETILYNLLSNAFKYTKDGTVSLKARTKGKMAIIDVIDTGPGLNIQEQQQIFGRYFRIDRGDEIEGMGIGLALAHELAEIHKGSLTVESEENKGSTFTLTLPIVREFYEQLGLEIGVVDHPLEKNLVASTRTTKGTLSVFHEDEPIILLVEDNRDMRQHLGVIFKDDYRILQASNGEEGLDLALKYVPDLIISDLMMPKLNGQEMLLAIKSNAKTSHIPFIMLTANHLEEEKLKGIKYGVDDYMTKPFSVEEIMLKVGNLIRSREQLKAKYRSLNLMESRTLSSNDAEREFWSKLSEVVKENLAVPGFTATDFARAMHMSRMQLHRKLKALTDLSATAFLRSQRLQVAAQLIKEGKGSVADIAYDVGFASPIYFSRCFKDMYGQLPKEYAG